MDVLWVDFFRHAWWSIEPFNFFNDGEWVHLHCDPMTDSATRGVKLCRGSGVRIRGCWQKLLQINEFRDPVQVK